MNYAHTHPISIMPLCVDLNGYRYAVDVRGKAIPSGKFFTCEVKDVGIFIIEAIANPLTKCYTWIADHDKTHAPLISVIKKEIERQMCA